MSVTGESFCHEVCEHVLCGAVFDPDCTLFDMIADEVKLDVNMLGLRVMCGVFGE